MFRDAFVEKSIYENVSGDLEQKEVRNIKPKYDNVVYIFKKRGEKRL